MLLLTLAGALLAGMPQQQQFDTDTTVSVSAGTRLSLENVGGEVTIRAWDRNQVRIQAAHSSRTRVGIRVSESVLRLTPQGSRGMGAMGGMVDYVLTVPAAMDIQLGGMFADVSIEGTRGSVSVNTVEGNISVKGGAGTLDLATVNGKITVEGANARLNVRAVSEDIELTNVQGEIQAETVSGDVTLTRIDGRRVEAQTVSGDVRFDGTLRPDGTYSLLTHSGDVIVAIPENASILIQTAVANGDVSASFDLPASERSSRRRQQFRLGSASATLELETFSGDIRLVRPSEIRTRNREE
ncbi:MAG TPA: DUF4097 family beta strand repeat-containing protein [Gemmatimonadales bacterium]|nr:DUF4097 family beta strand repeat-containing protein [Gemmatimonadales bacterium]